MRIGFGRYKGLRVEEVPADDTQYLAWLAAQLWVWPVLRDLALGEVRVRTVREAYTVDAGPRAQPDAGRPAATARTSRVCWMPSRDVAGHA